MSDQHFKDEVYRSCEALKAGGVLVYPTGTVWGIGCDARNEEAVQKVFELKERPGEKSLIVLLDDAAKITRYVRDVPDVAWDLIDLADKPLTIIYQGGYNLAPGVCAEDGSVAIRITTHPFCKALTHRFRFPIVSTSANLSGTPTPKHYRDIPPSILDRADYVVDLNRSTPSLLPPSTIIQLQTNGEFSIVRQ